jgi:hypothetical protein
MSMNRPEATGLRKCAKSLEESFFAKENERLLQKLREKEALEERRLAFKESLNLDNDEVIDALIALELEPQTVAAFSIVPLVTMAWADGEIQSKERAAIIRAAEERGIEQGSANHDLLENWLKRQPGPELMDTWKGYVDALRASLDPMIYDALRERVVSRTRAVAKAAGGILGLGSISKAEQAMLDRLEQSLS